MLDFLPTGVSFDHATTPLEIRASQSRYVSPSATVMTGEPQDARFIVCSSAGAVGKSALAAHLVREKNALGLDLSKFRLGTNSFVGTLVQIFGAGELAKVLAAIRSGQMVLVFDALDEAEVHSGREGVEIFLREVIQSCGSGSPSVVLLGRPDSARRVSALIKSMGSEVALLGIGYFSEAAAAEFCFVSYERARAARLASETVFKEKLKEFFKSGLSASGSSDSAWSDADSRFYGYAPVLQAVATVLAAQDNIHAYEFHRDKPRGAFVDEVMRSILRREQDKFWQNAESIGLKEKLPDSLYSLDDQILRLLKLSVREAGWDDVDDVDAEDVEAVRAAVQSFLPQHPFISMNESLDAEFSGPAFRDFCLACAFCSQSVSSRYFAEYYWVDKSPVTSSVLFDVYAYLGNGVVAAEHVDAVYFSFSSLKGKSDCFLDIYDSENKSFLVMERDEEFVEFEVSTGRISISNMLSNARIQSERPICLDAVDVIEVADSEIDAGALELAASALGITGAVSLVSREFVARKGAPISLRIRSSDSALGVNFPGDDGYPWARHRVDRAEQNDGDDAHRVSHVLIRILRAFRKHARSEFARYRDLVRKHFVGQSRDAQAAFDFLVSIGAVFERGNLYVLNTDVLDQHAIQWAGASDSLDSRFVAEVAQFLVDRGH